MSGILGAVDLTTNTIQSLFQCNAEYTMVTVNMCNRNSTAVTVSIAVSASATTPLSREWIEFNTPVGANAVLERTGIWLTPGQHLLVRTGQTRVSATCWGIRQGAETLAPIGPAPVIPGAISGAIIATFANSFADNPLQTSVTSGSVAEWIDGINYNTAASTQWARFVASNGSVAMTHSTSSSEVAVTTDGINWIAGGNLPARISDSIQWERIAAGPAGRWVASSYNTSFTNYTQIAYSTNNGTTWTNSSLPTAGVWTVTSGNNIFLAYNGTAIQTSTDAVTWTSAAVPTVNNNTSIDNGAPFYAAGVGWVAIQFVYLGVPGQFGLKIQISTDNCATWSAVVETAAIPGMTATPRITYGNGRMVAVVEQNAASWVSTNNGATWTAYPTAFSAYSATQRYFARVQYLKGYFIATTSQFSSFVNAVYWSADGVTWTQSSRGTSPVSYLASLD